MGSWDEEKLRAWERLWEDLEIGYLDTDILDVLLELFARPDTFPVSSCSGRIVVVDSTYPWERSDTNLVFKKHGPVTVEEILEVMGKPFAERLWLSVQGPIYHIYTRSIEAAWRLLETARRAGFKHSGILSCTRYCVVELRTGIRMATPVADRDGFRVDVETLKWLIDIANDVLVEAKRRNAKLLEALREARPSSLWEPAVRAISRLSRRGVRKPA